MTYGYLELARYAYWSLVSSYTVINHNYFSGKEEFFRGNFALETPLSCCCDIDLSYRDAHKKSVGSFTDPADLTCDGKDKDSGKSSPIDKCPQAPCTTVTTSTETQSDVIPVLRDSLSQLSVEAATVAEEIPSSPVHGSSEIPYNEDLCSSSANEISNPDLSSIQERPCSSSAKQISNPDLSNMQEKPCLSSANETSDPIFVSLHQDPCSSSVEQTSHPDSIQITVSTLPDIESAEGSQDCTTTAVPHNIEEKSSHANLEEVLLNAGRMFEEQCHFLEAFLCHTTDEGVVTEQASSSNLNDSELIVENLDSVIHSNHSLEEYTDSLLMHLDLISNDTEASRAHLLKIIEQSYDDVNVTRHISYQTAAKSVIVSAKQILMILDRIVSFGCGQDQLNTFICLGDSTESVREFLDVIPYFRDRLVHYVHIIGQVQKEIKRNELLRLRLLNSLELEAIQMEELTKIRNLTDQLSALHDQHEAVFGRLNRIITEGQPQEGEAANHNAIPPLNMDDVEGNAAVDALNDSSDSEITDDEVYDENSPELISLLKSEAKLLLQHAKYSHCPSCCPYAYTPRLEQLDITDINYQSEELATLTLKGFLTVNQGLKLLSVSWSCIDNSMVSDNESIMSPHLPTIMSVTIASLYVRCCIL